MDKEVNYLIILYIFTAIFLMAGFAFMQPFMQHRGTQINNKTPVPTVTPSSDATELPMATLVPGLAKTPAATEAPTSTPEDIAPAPVHDWTLNTARSGPTRPTGTITAIVKDEYDNPVEGQSIGVLRGSYCTIKGSLKAAVRTGGIDATTTGPEIPVPAEWVTTDANGSAFLGEFAYGNYTVYYRTVVPGDGYCFMTETIAVGEEHKNRIVNFDLTIID